MAPKKTAAKKPAAKPAELGSKDARWVRAQVATLKKQCEEAASRGDSWLLEAHQWHQEQLEDVLGRLEADSAVELPEELKTGVEFYVSQFEGGTATPQDEFYDDREVYSCFLTPDVKDDKVAYVRAEETVESRAIIEQVQGWEDTSQNGISKLAKMAGSHSSSAGVQEALLQKVAALCDDKKNENGAGVAGLAPKAMVTLVVKTADGLREDVELQLVAFAALRTLADGNGWDAVLTNGGVEMILSALRQHKANVNVCLISVQLISVLIHKCKPHSPEWAVLCKAGTEKTLVGLLDIHPTNKYLDKLVKTSVPFLRG